MNGLANQQSANAGLRELALFAGAGGGILGGKLLGWRTVCAVEWEPYPASVLVARQNDGILEPFPVWNDVQTFNGKPWAGRVDVVSGGFPCQDISSAGKGTGIEGERSGMWRQMARIISEVRPRFAFVENSPMLTSRGLGTVLGDLAAMGFDARWGVLGANSIGGPHGRARIWIVAANTAKNRRAQIHEIQKSFSPKANLWMPCRLNTILDNCKLWGDTKRGADYLGDELAGWVDESAALGNGQVPEVAATAWRMLGGQ